MWIHLSYCLFSSNSLLQIVQKRSISIKHVGLLHFMLKEDEKGKVIVRNEVAAIRYVDMGK